MLHIYSKNRIKKKSSGSSASSDSADSADSDDEEKYIINNNCKKCSKRMLYGIGTWANNEVIEITFHPKNGIPISWTAPDTLIPTNPTNTDNLIMQTPIILPSFSIFPLEINCGDKFIFKFRNKTDTQNAFACAANIDGIIHRTANNKNNTLSNYPNKINLETLNYFILVNPSYTPTTDILTRNIIDSSNYISISPNINTTYTLIWKL